MKTLFILAALVASVTFADEAEVATQDTQVNVKKVCPQDIEGEVAQVEVPEDATL